ncbi:MAG: hypothetical protein E8G75_06025 [Sulfitobacter sp. SK025]|nr:MAG: hypothetical protein E8G75_06025 [Sulfitobacter sp. SK025]
MVSQRVHHDDLIGHLLEIDPNGWTVVEIPAIAEEDRDYIIGEDEYYFRKAGEPLHAQLESLEILENIKTSVGSFVFQSQYQQNPMPPGGVLFKNDWFPRYKKTPFLKSFDRIVESWDTASSIGSDAAYSACTTWGERGNKRTLLCCQRHRLEFPDLLRVIQSSARAHWAHAILIENKSSGQQAIQSLRGKNLNIIPIQPVGDKESRALQASAIIEAGRVEIPQEAPWLPEYLDELLKFPHCKYKDQVDSTVQYLLWAEKTTPKFDVRMTRLSSDGCKEVYKDNYFSRNGRGVFDDFF